MKATAPHQVVGSLALEMTWIVVPLVIALSMFVWGAALYFDAGRPPANAAEVFVIGKQWMFYVQHATGQREINELHVPTGRATKLTMSSEDVIHSFFIPAFRVKRDVLPGASTQHCGLNPPNRDDTVSSAPNIAEQATRKWAGGSM